MAMGVRLPMTRLLATFAIGLQMILQGALAVGPSHGFDVTSLYCASPDLQRDPDVTAALQELAISTGLEQPADQTDSDHCPLCVLAHGAPLQAQPRLIAPGRALSAITTAVYESAFHTLAQGPPLGSRAPPALT